MKRKVFIVLTLAFMLIALAGCGKKYTACEDITYCNFFNKGLLATEMNGRWGYIDSKDKVVINHIFDGAGAFYDDTAIVIVAGSYQLIDKKGNTLLAVPYDHLMRDTENGYIWYRSGGRYGLMDPKGKIITQLFYDNYRSFSDGLAAVKVGEKWGYIDTKGEFKIAASYDDARHFSQGLAAVKKNDKFGYINKSEKVIIEFKYDSASTFDDAGRAVVTEQGAEKTTYHLIDTKDKKIITGEDISGRGPLYRVKHIESWYLYTAKGEKFNDIAYQRVWSMNTYVVNVEDAVSDRMEVYSSKGKLLHTVLYKDYLNQFEVDGKHYIAEKLGTQISIFDGSKTFTFDGDRILQIKNGLLVIRRNEKYGIINFKDKVIVDFNYQNLFITEDGYFAFMLNDLTGVMNTKGKILIEAKYQDVNPEYQP